MAEWISVEERLPEPDTLVLCIEMDTGPEWVPEPHITIGRLGPNNEWDTEWRRIIEPINAIYHYQGVAYWLPIPELPEEVEA